MQIGVYVYNRIAANLHLVICCLKMELLNGRSIGRCIVFGKIPHIRTKLYSQHFLGYFGKQIQIVI